MIDAGNDSVVVIRSGAVVMRTLQADGTESLLCLFGPGEAVQGQAAGSGGVELAAHSETLASIRPWCEGCPDGEMARQLARAQVTLTAWSVAQARPQVDRRVRGLLRLLADRFGRDGRMIDLRLTHQQLAEAVHSTRPTVSRALRELLRSGLVRFDGAGDYRRISIRQDELDSPNDGI